MKLVYQLAAHVKELVNIVCLLINHFAPIARHQLIELMLQILPIPVLVLMDSTTMVQVRSVILATFPVSHAKAPI